MLMDEHAEKDDQINQAPADIIEIVDENLRQGFAQVPRPILRAKGLSVKAKLVYIALLDYAWQSGSCFPGQPRLAADLDTSVDTVQRALGELKSYRLVNWKRQGLNRPNIYYILRLAENPHLKTTDGGNRRLRFPEAASSGVKKPQSSGIKNTQREKYSTSKRDSRDRSSKEQDGASTAVGPLRSSGFRHIREALSHPSTNRLMSRSVGLERASRSAGRPSNKARARPEAPFRLHQTVLEVSHELGDTDHLASNLRQTARLWAQSGHSEQAFVQLMYEARSRTMQAGRVRNRMPYFFACLRELLGIGQSLVVSAP